jgi:4-hydroxybenzoate polyprenyltransferase
MRPVHWIKNGFVLAPLLFAFRDLTPETAAAGVRAAAAFCFASSGVYIVNDLTDRERDRLHPQKRHRPIASGTVSVRAALLLLLTCAAAAAAFALTLPWHVGAFIGGYVALNIAYSWKLKHLVLIDVMTIACGFILRILAGGASTGIPPSPWMLHTTFFLSLFLGFTKRMSELVTITRAGRRQVLQQYSRSFLTLMVTMSVSLTIVTYSLYVFFPRLAAGAAGGGLVYTVPLVVYGLLRYLYLAVKRNQGGDVSEVILRDVPLIISIGLWIVVVTALVGLRL